MTKEEVDYHVQESLRDTFDRGDKDKQIIIYNVSESLGFYEQAEEMKSDIKSDHNINLD